MKDGLVDMDNMLESNDDLSSDVEAAPSVGKTLKVGGLVIWK